MAPGSLRAITKWMASFLIIELAVPGNEKGDDLPPVKSKFCKSSQQS